MSLGYRKPAGRFKSAADGFNRRKPTACACPIGMHPSKLEAAVCQIMELRVKAGDIRNVKRQATVHLGFGVKWKVDFGFEYCATDSPGWAEAKGQWDRVSAQKKKMWKNGAGPGPLEVWQGSYARPRLVETIIPAGVPK